MHIEEGTKNPIIVDMARLQQVLKGIKLAQAKQGQTKAPEILSQIKQAWEREGISYDKIMIWAVGFQRASRRNLCTIRQWI